MTGRRTLAIVVPTLDEARHLPLLLDDLSALEASVIVSDGGSRDGTVELARSAGALVVVGPRGRARQLRAGARAAEADWLFFVHADSRLSSEALSAIDAVVRRDDADGFAHLRFSIDARRPFYRVLEAGQRLRERVFGLAYGDQGLLVSKALYERAGGYPEWPILEDVGMLDRLTALGRRHALPERVVTSARRYEAEGRAWGWIRNTLVIVLYRFGVSPSRLARWFPRRPASGPGDPPRRAVIVFAKAPRPGFVKTRLAADVGADEAVRIYRGLGRATVDALRDGDADVFVYYDPPDAEGEAETKAWLGSERVTYRPQSAGDLGARLRAAFAERFREADEVCVVGTDIPGIGADTTARAFRALADHEVVLGPATDGGYYLLALREPLPRLFHNVPWSTDAVLSVTLARANEVNAGVDLMDVMTDVDTVADLPPGLQAAGAAGTTFAASPCDESAGPSRLEESPPWPNAGKE